MASPSQQVIILAGLPGSGKTTLAHRLTSLGYVWINQVRIASKSCATTLLSMTYVSQYLSSRDH